MVTGDKIRGKLLKVTEPERGIILGPSPPTGYLEELKNKDIEFILKVGVFSDILYISKHDWEEYFREGGLIEPTVVIETRLEKVITEKGEISLYTKSDVDLRVK